MIMMKKNTEEEERKNRKREKNTERIKKRKMSLNRVVIRTEGTGLLAFNLTLDRLRFVFDLQKKLRRICYLCLLRKKSPRKIMT